MPCTHLHAVIADGDLYLELDGSKWLELGSSSVDAILIVTACYNNRLQGTAVRRPFGCRALSIAMPLTVFYNSV